MHPPVVPVHLAAVRPADTTSRAAACTPARFSISVSGAPVHFGGAHRAKAPAHRAHNRGCG